MYFAVFTCRPSFILESELVNNVQWSNLFLRVHIPFKNKSQLTETVIASLLCFQKNMFVETVFKIEHYTCIYIDSSAFIYVYIVLGGHVVNIIKTD